MFFARKNFFPFQCGKARFSWRLWELEKKFGVEKAFKKEIPLFLNLSRLGAVIFAFSLSSSSSFFELSHVAFPPLAPNCRQKHPRKMYQNVSNKDKAKTIWVKAWNKSEKICFFASEKCY